MMWAERGRKASSERFLYTLRKVQDYTAEKDLSLNLSRCAKLKTYNGRGFF